MIRRRTPQAIYPDAVRVHTLRAPLKIIFCSIAALGGFLRSSCIAYTLRFSKATRLALKQNLIFRGALSIPIWSCSGRGLPCHKRLPVVRCALTAPFHPYLITRK